MGEMSFSCAKWIEFIGAINIYVIKSNFIIFHLFAIFFCGKYHLFKESLY